MRVLIPTPPGGGDEREGLESEDKRGRYWGEGGWIGEGETEKKVFVTFLWFGQE
jgi:hypothetical protein